MFDCGTLPEDSADLARVSVELPTVGRDTPSESPVDIPNIIDYLSREAPGGEQLSVADLSFQRTVDLGDAQYWVWSFHEPDGHAGVRHRLPIGRRHGHHRLRGPLLRTEPDAVRTGSTLRLLVTPALVSVSVGECHVIGPRI